MVHARVEFGEHVLTDVLNSLGEYILVTMEEPWDLLRGSTLLRNMPREVIFNRDMGVENLESIEHRAHSSVTTIVGFGGGTSCDTAKYLSWKWAVPSLIIAPSIISVDAWLCTSIAVRVDRKVRYIGNVQPARVLVDFSIIKKAPKSLNIAGVSDTISIATALGDWSIASEFFGDKIDWDVFREAKEILLRLIDQQDDIAAMSNRGIEALVKGFEEEVRLCEAWGNARPEEGGEHFLAYCLESITGGHYIHGNLIGLNVLVVLKLQREQGAIKLDSIKDFLDAIGLEYSPRAQSISRQDYKKALESVQSYVTEENLQKGLWSLKCVFDMTGEYSIDGIIDWIFGF